MSTKATERVALIHTRDALTVERYLPSGYRVAGVGYVGDDLVTVITGHDSAGWTLDSYVLPRLASGLLFGHEVCQDGHRPDDSSDPEDRCRGCGQALTWRGPGPNDWDATEEES